MMKKIIVVFIILVVVGVVFFKFKDLSDKNKDIVQVNGIRIKQAAYDKKLEESTNFFKYQKQNTSNLITLQKDTIDTLIDESLINQYATKNKISVSESEVNTRYLQAVEGYNRRNKIKGAGDDKFLLKIKEMYGAGKSDYLQTLKMDILKEKVQSAVKMPLVRWLEAQRKSADIKIL